MRSLLSRHMFLAFPLPFVRARTDLYIDFHEAGIATRVGNFKRDLEIALGNEALPFWHSSRASALLPIDKNALKGSTAFYRAPQTCFRITD